jgi:CheY-like chemotaxis protein
MSSRILIIDDNSAIHADFRKVLLRVVRAEALDDMESLLFGAAPTTSKPESLAEPEYELDFAFQGQEAYSKVLTAVSENRPYRLAFVDVRMPPGWDGIQTIAKLRTLDPNLRYVVCTAYSDYSLEEARRNVGITGGMEFINKPFDADAVRALASKLTARSSKVA